MGRNKRGGLFLPDERCLGGAMELNATYHNYMRKAHSAYKVPSSKTSGQPTAQQLSLQRVRKLMQSDPTAYNHYQELQHLQRRLNRVQGLSSRPSRPHPTGSSGPAPCSAATARATASLCPWLPNQQGSSFRRPSTASGALICRPSSRSGMEDNSSSSSAIRQQPPDWQMFKQQPNIQPPVQPLQLPQSRYYPGPSILPSVQHNLYKASIMTDILARELYKPKDIKALCASYLEVNPAEHRALLRLVVAEVLTELNVA